MRESMNLYKHQSEGVHFLLRDCRSSMLCDEMGLGKSRQALVAAQYLRNGEKIDRVLVLCPAAVRYSWQTELEKVRSDGFCFDLGEYDAKSLKVHGSHTDGLPIVLLSYGLLPQQRHTEALRDWCSAGKTLLVCDESSFLKNRTAKTSKAANTIGKKCAYRWLLTGTPIANSPLDLWSQGLVMSNGNGPLRGFKNWYQFRARYGVLQTMHIGRKSFQQCVGYQNVEELTKKFAPYVLRREKKDCLDLPEKTYEVREIALTVETWKIYCELKKEALLCLPDSEERPEPNAAVRLLRLCQLTSGHVGGGPITDQCQDALELASEDFIEVQATKDISSEKLSWLAEQILDGELASERALIVWCRWRRERERLYKLLQKQTKGGYLLVQIYGGQSQKDRESALGLFGTTTQDTSKCIMLAQPHAGGFGLNLTVASTAVYLSNDFSYTTRIQSEDRCHRIGQTNPVTYLDVLATGPAGQRTVDHAVLEAL